LEYGSIFKQVFKMFTQIFKACHHLMLNLSSNASQAEDATSSQN